MTNLLLSYLLNTGKLPLAGIGVLESRYTPAKYDVADRAFLPPGYSLHLAHQEEGAPLPVQQLIGFIARQLDLPEEEAFERYQSFLGNMRAELAERNRLDWGTLGYFEPADSGYQFFSHPFDNAFAALPAEKIIREGASHQMKVGDTETTTTAMEAYFNDDEIESDKWWLLPMLIAIAAIVLIVWKRFGS